MNKTCLLLALASYILSATFANAYGYSDERKGRIGLGFSNQLKIDVPAISLKIHQGKSFAMGGLLGINTGDDGGHGVGFKAYSLIYDEPQLNFYLSFLGALLSDKTNGESKSGFQTDLTFGSEFSFSGLESIGFSFEFGVSLNKIQEVEIETTANHFVTAGVHFYL